MAEEKQEGQKTVVSFVVGLLIGGLLVWAFSSPTESTPKTEKVDTNDTTEVEVETTNDTEEEVSTSPEETTPVVEKPVLSVGAGKITVKSQTASAAVLLDSATYPVSEGWVGVRDYDAERLGGLLGVVRFSESQGLVPTQIVLQRPTTAGRTYAVVVYEENGDKQFNLAEDAQVGEIYATFTAE